MTTWKLKSSRAKNARLVGVIRITKNNLTGEFMDLNKLGEKDFSYKLEAVGVYRVVNNADRSKRPKQGCYLVYILEEEDFYRSLPITDAAVKKIPEKFLQDANYINELARNIKKSNL